MSAIQEPPPPGTESAEEASGHLGLSRSSQWGRVVPWLAAPWIQHPRATLGDSQPGFLSRPAFYKGNTLRDRTHSAQNKKIRGKDFLMILLSNFSTFNFATLFFVFGAGNFLEGVSPVFGGPPCNKLSSLTSKPAWATPTLQAGWLRAGSSP